MLQPERGQVKVATYANSGLLTVHVIQARNLQSKWQEKCNAYIKVTLHPEDEEQSTKCKTEVISQCNQPKFDEKFSFELLEEDVKKRILVSAWHHQQDTGHNEFLGCMSFGIQHIVSNRRTVNGWYYLLTEKLGKRKHLQVAVERNVNADYDVSIISKVNKDLACMEPYVFVLKKEVDEDHGIEVTGAFPVIVSNIIPGCPAESIGLQPGDRIVRINGFNVSRSTEESVSRILRSCEKQVILEVQRPRSSSRSKASKSKAPRPVDIQEGLDEENYMDQASIMKARYNMNRTQQEMAYNAHIQMLAMQNGHIQDNMGDNRSMYSVNIHETMTNQKSSNMYESLPSVNTHTHKQSNRSLMHHGRVLSQKSINVDLVEDGYYSEGQPMSRMHTKMVTHDNGYTSDTRSMRRTSTRAPVSFREDGYFSECQPMRRPKSLHYHPIPEDEIYESQYLQSQLEQSMSHVGGIGGMHTQARTQSRGVTAASRYHDGYCSEGQPLHISKRNRMPLPTLGEEGPGYYSEGGQGMRAVHQHMNTSQHGSVMNIGPSGHTGLHTSALTGHHSHDIGHHQVMTREQLEQMYHQGDHGSHDHGNGCPFHQHIEEQEALQQYHGKTKRDKVAAWLDKIPDPKDMHQNTTENPFPETANQINHVNSKGMLQKNKGHDSNKLQGLGLDPIYEEPECSVSMLTHKRHQLEPIAEDSNKENKHGSKTSGVKLFALCGGIAAKKKKKKAISC